MNEGPIASDALGLFGAVLAGLVLGGGYFAGLWVTVRGLRRVARPGWVLLGSTVVRVALVLGGLLVVTDGRWERLVAALAGFVTARIVLTRWAARPRRPETGG